MKRLFHFLAAVLSIAALGYLGTGVAAIAGDVSKVSGAWARPTVAGATTGAVFFGIQNTSGKDIVLTGASTDIADRVEIHEMTIEGDVMKMRPLPAGIAIPAGEQIALEPGGLHIMLIGLKKKLNEGEPLQLTLVFDGGASQVVRVAVQTKAPDAMPRGSNSGTAAKKTPRGSTSGNANQKRGSH